MRTLLLILAIIWFVLFTCIGNYAAVKVAKDANEQLILKTWGVLLDVLAVAYLITRALGAA